jgi:ADP-ribose pyrophosphatase YjhB (NUDIX family)
MSITLQVGVKIFLRNAAGNYLLLRRSKKRYPNIENFWDIPGGRIEPGTNLFENVVREVREETSLSIVGTPVLIHAQDILRSDKHIVRLTFLGCAEGTVTLDEDHTDFRWLTLKEMTKLKELDEFTREVIEQKKVKII